MKKPLALLCLSLSLSACGTHNGLNPISIVGQGQETMLVQNFLARGASLAKMAGYQQPTPQQGNDFNSNDRFDHAPKGFLFLNMPPIRKTVPYILAHKDFDLSKDRENRRSYTAKSLAIEYVQLGFQASSLICKNYMLGEYEKNLHVEQMQKYFGNVVTLTGVVLSLLDPNKTIFRGFSLAAGTGAILNGSLNGLADDYQAYRYLEVSNKKAMGHVLTRQRLLLKLYTQNMKDVSDEEAKKTFTALSDKHGVMNIHDLETDGESPTPLLYFSWAINAVHNIEFACTRKALPSILEDALEAGGATQSAQATVTK